jgi:hypothetical protein
MRQKSPGTIPLFEPAGFSVRHEPNQADGKKARSDVAAGLPHPNFLFTGKGWYSSLL